MTTASRVPYVMLLTFEALLMTTTGCSRPQAPDHGTPGAIGRQAEEHPGHPHANPGEPPTHQHGDTAGPTGHTHGNTAGPTGHTHGNTEGHQGNHHGNPEDLGDYVARMESPERAEWQKPDEVVEKLGLAPGAVACDIGTGPGYFSLRLSKAVGERGTVYAVDVEPRMLGLLRDRIGKEGTRNVIPVLGLHDDPLLPARVCDVVLMVNALHHFANPVAYLKRLQQSLKPGGRIINIDFHKRPTPMGPPVESRIDRADVLALADQAGLKVRVEHDALEYQYFIELTPKQPRR